MRWLVVALAAFALVVPASAASVDPRLYVLSQADVPRGYLFEKDNSLLIPKGIATRGTDEEARLLRRAGFEGAYLASYRNTAPPHWKSVHSGAYVFREPSGARIFVRFAFASGRVPFRKSGRRIDLGDEAWTQTEGSDETAVLWRYRSVVAYVSCSGTTRHRTLALAQARKQQRRIAAQLR